MDLHELIKSCPNPASYKNDSELAQAYKNWYYGVRGNNLPICRVITLLLIFALSSLACGAPLATIDRARGDAFSAGTSPTAETSMIIEMSVIAEKLNVRACEGTDCAAEDTGLHGGEVKKVYLVCTGGQLAEWVSINRDCTRWVKTEWLEVAE